MSLSNDRDFYKSVAQKIGQSRDWDIYRTKRNHTTNAIKYAKKSYYSDTIKENKNDGNKLWKTIKSIIPKKGRECVEKVVVNGTDIKEPKEIANAFNIYFYRDRK